MNHLPQMDLIVVMKEGRITEIGGYQELIEKKGAFAEFVTQFLSQEEEADSKGESSLSRMLFFPFRTKT